MKADSAIQFTAGLFAALSLQGCGTVVTHTIPKADATSFSVGSGLYRGARWDATLVSLAASKDHEYRLYGIAFAPFWLCDLPVSCAVDTLFIPFDAASNQSTNQPPDKLPEPAPNGAIGSGARTMP